MNAPAKVYLLGSHLKITKQGGLSEEDTDSAKEIRKAKVIGFIGRSTDGA